MTNGNFKVIITALALLFLMSFMNTCNSCSSSRKIDDLSVKVDGVASAVDNAARSQSTHLEIRLDMLQAQIVNQFLSMFNSEKYKNEIELNAAKINALRQQIKILEQQNDTAKAHRP
jgi:sensor histidine kinase YesM